MEQKIVIKAKDKNNHLIGTFTITNEIPDVFINKFNKIFNLKSEVKIDNCILYNIPIVDNIEDENLVFSSIIYCKDFSEFPNILLAEEVRYKIHFKPNSNYEKDYELFSSFLSEPNELKPIDLLNPMEGYLNFRSYVGKTFLDITKDNVPIFSQAIEIRSKKMDYHSQYKAMIGDLSNYSSGLIFYSNSPVYQEFTLDIQAEKNYYEYFMFFEYLFRDENLPSTFEYLSRNLYTKLEEETQTVPSSVASYITPDSLIDMLSNPENLEESKEDIYLVNQLNGYLPRELNEITYRDDIDTPENRFYKNFLETIDDLIDKLIESSSKSDYIKEQLLKYKEKLSYFLSQSYFKDIGRMDFPPLNSQVLQKKEGYRDILQYFLMLEFTFRMHWGELSDKFVGYEKKLSELYELWCYFQLLEVLQELTKTEVKFEDIFNENDWSLSLHKGKAVREKLFVEDKEIAIELRYNKTFSNNNEYFKSYSLNLKPDYTFVIKFDDKRLFIHFDAKYRVYLDSENFKEGDIYKMHTYKDAILDSVGAFVLYPGEKKELYEDIHEYKYGVGAFPLNPGDDGKNKEELVEFLKKLINSLISYHNFNF